jgi:protein-S-isoprenylcysteine O-methyltransferase Ste14
MALREQMALVGQDLFRWRSYLPAVCLLLFAAGFVHYRYPLGSHRLDQLWEGVCLAVAGAGLAVRALVVGYTPRGTSGRNTHRQKARQLNTTGMYSLVRHPLYLANLLIFLGVVLFFHQWAITSVAALAYWLYYERIMLAEEDYLRAAFGAEFEDWAERTPAFLPRLGGWVRPERPFSFRNVLRREHNTFFGVVLTMTALEVVSERVVSGRFGLEPMWGVIFFPSLAVYLTLHALKHFTRVLEVPGR